MTTTTKTPTPQTKTPHRKTSGTKTSSTKNSGTTSTRASKRPAKKADTPEQVVADRILELLDKGELPPWEKGWTSSKLGTPQNAISHKSYRGINLWMTLLTQMVNGYNDPRWLTYRQANELGGHVRKGEKSTNIVFWKLMDRTKDVDPNVEYIPNPESSTPSQSHGYPQDMTPSTNENQGRKDRYWICRIYHVFNAEQTIDCNLPELAPPPIFTDPIEEAEAIITHMPNPPGFETYGLANHPPHYNPQMDVIRIPERSRYDQVEVYYNTIFHELTHSTGHESRLARPSITKSTALSHDYGVEELVAGMGSAMLADRAQIGQKVIDADASYIRHWRDAISADKSIVMKAAQQGQKAVDYILGTSPANQPEESETATSEPHSEPEMVS